MLKAKTNKNAHKSRTIDEAIKEVQKVEQSQFAFHIPKKMHSDLKIKAAQDGKKIRDIMIDLISNYLES